MKTLGTARNWSLRGSSLWKEGVWSQEKSREIVKDVKKEEMDVFKKRIDDLPGDKPSKS